MRSQAEAERPEEEGARGGPAQAQLPDLAGDREAHDGRDGGREGRLAGNRPHAFS